MRFFGCLFLILLAATIGCGDEALEDPLEEEVEVVDSITEADQNQSDVVKSYHQILEEREAREEAARNAEAAAMTDPVALKQAQALVAEVQRRRDEAQAAAEAADDFSKIVDISEEIYAEVLKFERGKWHSLASGADFGSEQYRKLEKLVLWKLSDGTYSEWRMEYLSFFDDLVAAYVMLTIMHPNFSEARVHLEFSIYADVGGAEIRYPDYLDDVELP